MNNIFRYHTHYQALLKLGWPIVVGQLGIIVLSFADTIMVGRHSTNELAAASFVNSLFNLVIIFATGFSYGLTPVVGNLFGQGKLEDIGQVLKNALWANLSIALLFSGVMGILYANLHRLGQPAELLPLMRPYYIILLVSFIFVLLFNAFKQFSDGITDTTTPMWILLGGNTLNIVGNWLLIYGKLGFPEWGLLGAGVSTLFSRVIMVICFIFLFYSAKRYRPYRQGFHASTFNVSDFKLLHRLGWPVGLQMGMETASFSLSTILVGWLGTVALAAHQVMITVGQLGFMLYYGMAAAVAVRVSHFQGQQDTIGIQSSVKAGFHIILLMALGASLLILSFRHQLGDWFTENSEVTFTVAQLVIPFVVYQFGDGLQCNYANALRGIADVKPLTGYAFIAYFLISLPAAYLFSFVLNGGILGVWYSFPLGLTSAGLLYYLRFRSRLRSFQHPI